VSSDKRELKTRAETLKDTLRDVFSKEKLKMRAKAEFR
jgi:hypothetical protein